MAEEHEKLPLDDELVDYVSLSKHLKEDTDRKKKQLSVEFEQMGGKYLQEIERKNKDKELKQVKLIPYILKHRSDIHDQDELMSYSLEDVQDIYDEVKKEKKSSILKFFHFMFNIE
jgi:hypothetical protein